MIWSLEDFLCKKQNRDYDGKTSRSMRQRVWIFEYFNFIAGLVKFLWSSFSILFPMTRV